MKTLLTILCCLIIFPTLNSQCPSPEALEYQDGNNIKALITNGGDLFYDGEFIAPANDLIPKSSIFAAGLWMGGMDSNGNLKVAAQNYGRYNFSFDYAPGPLNEDGSINYEHCEHFNKIWKVSKEDIELHKADFQDNGIIDDPVASIFGWPGRHNNQFYYYNDFLLYDMDHGAPFFDQNGDNIYDPEAGDYPHPPNTIPGLAPASMTWSVFNDNTLHTESFGDPLKAEIQLTSWSFDCFANAPLSNTVFTSHKIINKSLASIDSFHVGLWVDFDLGCYLDDYMGSYPEKNAFYVYNSDDLDGVTSIIDCEGVPTYGETIPAQSIQFLNKELTYFTYHNGPPGVTPPPPSTYAPETPGQHFNYMTGAWSDGTLFTYGDDGYSPAGDIVQHVFPDNPNDPNGWSMYNEALPDGDRRVLSSYAHNHFAAQEVLTLDIAYTFHRYSNIGNHLEIVDQMYPEIDQIQQMYDMKFNSWCGVITDTDDISQSSFQIYPNPSNGEFSIEAGHLKINSLKLYDISGKLLWQENNPTEQSKILKFGYLNNGIYVLLAETKEEFISKRLIINK